MDARVAKRKAFDFLESTYQKEFDLEIEKIKNCSARGEFSTKLATDNILVLDELKKLGYKIIDEYVYWR